jgi:hypothetical protein
MRAMQAQGQELEQLIKCDARSHKDGRRILNKLARSRPDVWLARPSSILQPSTTEPTTDSPSSFAAAMCSNAHGNVSFDILCTPSHIDGLEAVCLALMEHYQDIKAFKFAGVDQAIAKVVEAIFSARGCKKLYNEPCDRMSLSVAPSNVQHLQDPSYIMDTLALSDVQVVNDNWTYKSPYSVDLITEMISKYHTSCIRLKSTGEAVCWVLEYPDGSVGMLFTQPEHRRKGLAKICMQDISRKVLAAGGGEVYCYATKPNIASYTMLTSLGFVSTGDFIWMAFSRPAGASGHGAVLPGP